MRPAAFVIVAALSACTPSGPAEPAAVAADAELSAVVDALALRGADGDTTRAAVLVGPEAAEVLVTLDDAEVERLERAGWTVGPAVVRAPLVAVGPPGARPEPSLAMALVGRRVALAPPGTPLGDLAREALAGLEGVLDAPLDTLAADDPAEAVAEGQAESGLAFAPQALSATRLAVTYRVREADAPPAGVRVAVRPDASEAARAFAEALAAPEAFRLWATFGFGPPR